MRSIEGPALKAHKLTRGQRTEYGTPLENHDRIADFWTVRLADKLKPGVRISAHDVTACMRLLKEARLLASPGHEDSLVDIAGYADVEWDVHVEAQILRMAANDAIEGPVKA